MSFSQEVTSWLSPPKIDVRPPVNPGSTAPSGKELKLPCDDQKPAVVTFLRHCGCPFAEKTFRLFRDAASKHPQIHFIAISHSSQEHTTKWLEEVGGAGNVNMVVDQQRKIYGNWGLGPSNFSHILSPGGFLALYQLGKQEGIWNRPTESGFRWQTAGSWAVDGKGLVVWGGPQGRADEIPSFESVAAKL